ncbi:MAG: ribosome biogenesis GTPase YlqF [Bacilli bacterium]
MANEEKGFQKGRINYYPGHMAKTKRELKENIKLIDVIYELVDARLPKSSKIKDIDELIKDKKRILIMTKKDLCDLDITIKWQKYYESLGYKVLIMDLVNGNDYKKLISITKEMMEDIQIKRLEKGLKEKEIRVAVIGIPNVGKSTLINKLAGKKVTNVANKPGVTKQINWLKTNNGLLLLDTPGILWPKIEDNEESLNLAITGSIKMEVLNITDLGGYIVSYLKNYYPDILEEKYKIKVEKDPMEIFKQIAKKMNAYKDNEIDYEKICEKLYNDIISGKIKGVTFDKWKEIY